MKARESGMPEEAMWQGFFRPEAALRSLGLDGECRDVLDLGCGYGTFAVPAARICSGVVYAIDIEEEMVTATRQRAESAGVSNIVVAQRDFVRDGSGVPDGSTDYAMLFNILHAEGPHVLLGEARRVLSPNGILGVIHWNYDASTPRGPSMEVRPRPEQIRSWAEDAGFEVTAPGQIDLPPYHYGFAFRFRG